MSAQGVSALAAGRARSRRGGPMIELARLRVYRFDPSAVFEGGLLAAIERVELGMGETRRRE